MDVDIISINIGELKQLNYRGRKEMSGIYKQPVQHRVYFSSTKLGGDVQADNKHHGGIDKAVCVYCYDHYAYWEDELDIGITPGFFGENLTVKGITEEKVFIGDTFKLGEAIIQVSEPRIPCYKTSAKSGVMTLQDQMVKTGYTGFYCRVIKEGWVSPDDSLIPHNKASDSVSIAFLNHIFYHDKNNKEAINQISGIKELASSWFSLLQKSE